MLLTVRDLAVSFPLADGVVHAVNDVSFEIARGRILGIVGESGSGKSVTARALMRMVRSPGVVDHGSVVYGGRDLLQIGEHEMRHVRGRDIAMVFQDPQSALNPAMRVGDQVAEALRVHGVGRDDARTRARELFEQVGIPDVERTLDLYPHEFSGGMRQRVVIAAALANNPALLIADEPTTALDVTIQAQILQLLSRLRTELGVAIIMITHDMGVVAELCDDLLVMYGGRVVERGSVADVFAEPKHPYTNALLKAVPRLELAHGALPAIPGSPPDPARLPVGCSFEPRCPSAIPECAVSRPPLEQVAPGREAACWVSASGRAVTDLPTPAVRPQTREATAEPVLVVSDLRVDLGSRPRGLAGRTPPVYAVNGVSLSLARGETLGLVGESGCGKSTLSRTVVGVNKASGGSIRVAGRDVTAMDKRDVRTVTSTIQYVFQDPYAALNPRRTIGQSLQEALAVAGLTGTAAGLRARELMGTVGLSAHQLDRYPHAFSGGQRQRVGIARALAAEPQLLILDEPVSALDVSIQAQIINLLERLRDELGLGYLFIAHDLSVVRHISDRVAVMYLGTIVEEGEAEQVYGAPAHPYTASLLSATPALHGHPTRERVVLVGDLPSPARPPSGCPFRTRCPIGPLYRPERQVCIDERPVLAPTATGQSVACHFAGELTLAETA